MAESNNLENHKKAFVVKKEWLYEVRELKHDDTGLLFMAILNFVNNRQYQLNENIEFLFKKYTKFIVDHWNTYNHKTKKFHWNYKGGITSKNKIIRDSKEIKYWRINVFERDNYTCQKCHTKGGILNAHHIKPFALFKELRTEIENGITLCETCHKIEHKKEVANV